MFSVSDFGDSQKHEILNMMKNLSTHDREELITLLIKKMSGGKHTQYKLRQRRGKIVMDEHRRVVMKIFDDWDTWRQEMNVASTLLTKKRDMNDVGGLVKVLMVIPRFRLIVYENRFSDGLTLRDMFAHNKKLSLTQSMTIASNLRDIVVNLHRHGVFHGDIKEDNILVNPKNGAVHFIDLGDVNFVFPHQNTKTPCIITGSRRNVPRCIATSVTGMGAPVDPVIKEQLDHYALNSLLKRLFRDHTHVSTPQRHECQKMIHHLDHELSTIQHSVQSYVRHHPHFF